MDLAPLSEAHAHARKAALQTQNANASGAREEHELAADDFAKTKNGIQDLEVCFTVSRFSGSQLIFTIGHPHTRSPPATPRSPCQYHKVAIYEARVEIENCYSGWGSNNKFTCDWQAY